MIEILTVIGGITVGVLSVTAIAVLWDNAYECEAQRTQKAIDRSITGKLCGYSGSHIEDLLKRVTKLEYPSGQSENIYAVSLPSVRATPEKRSRKGKRK